MDQRNIQQEFQDQFNDVVSRLQSKQFFRSDWDIASFAVFFIFIASETEGWNREHGSGALTAKLH
ncbi:hypothetical protein PAMP_009688 [Pampus punctatissimus]